MRIQPKQLRLHAVWLAVCLGIVMFCGIALSTKKGEPLTRETFVNVAQETLPAVVSITLNQVYDAKQMSEELKKLKDFWDQFQFFGQQVPGPEDFLKEDEQGRQVLPVAGGSGVIIRDNGYVVTNYHVVAPAVDDKEIELTVSLHGGEEYSGKQVEVVAYDSLRDLAVLKIDAKNLPVLKWGNSDDLSVGEWVLAVGNPLELEGTASEGIVSQKHRKIEKAPIEDLLQITAMINPGNSGGALVNLDGELVGINMAIATNTGRWQGVGFAIPSSQAKFVTDSIIEHGKVIQGYIGIRMSNVTEDKLTKKAAQYYGLLSREGVLIDEVTSGGAAEAAGLRKGDVIVSIEHDSKKEKIARNMDLLSVVAQSKVGSKVKVTYYRNGKEQTTMMTIKERPSDVELDEQMKTKDERQGEFKTLGLMLQKATPPEKGVAIVSVMPKSPASKAEPISLNVGDIIKEVDEMTVETPTDVREALKSRGKDGLHMIKFTRANREMTTFVQL